MDNKRRSDDRSLRAWWSRWRGFIGYVALVAMFAFSIFRIESERMARSDAVAAIIEIGCETDNGQDRLLGSLVAVSLEGAEGQDLTDREQQGLELFEAALVDLTATTPCSDLIEAFRNGEPPDIPETNFEGDELPPPGTGR